jgi:tetratricopeptide (TPR) repeat protein
MALSSFKGENHIGNASMHAIASSSFLSIDVSSLRRLIVFPNEVEPGRFYQEIAQRLITTVSATSTVSNVTTRLISLADSAQVNREFDIVNGLSRLIFSLPVSSRLGEVGRYYKGLSLSRSAGGDVTRADALFKEVAEVGGSRYRAKAMLALGTNSVAIGDHRTATSFYREVIRILDRDRVFDPMTLYTAARMTSLMKSLEDDHRGALSDLEKLLPLVRMASFQQPYAYYDYLNTLAVELTEAGRLEEAKNAARIALASPFAYAYPEWRDTLDEIEHRELRASRSTIAVSQRDPTETNLAKLPPRPRESAMTVPEGQSQPLARIIKFPARTPSTSELNQRSEELELLDKRRIVSEKLYEMFLSALDGAAVNRELVEELYKVFLRKRKQH